MVKFKVLDGSNALTFVLVFVLGLICICQDSLIHLIRNMMLHWFYLSMWLCLGSIRRECRLHLKLRCNI